MDEHEPRQYQVQIKGGETVTIWMREKGRETQDGVEGVVFALLHPKSLMEVGEYWVPTAHNSWLER
jgi:hypothetical protein